MINPVGLASKGPRSEVETYYDTIVYFQEHDFEYVYIKNPMYIIKEDIGDAMEKMKEEDIDCLILSNKTVDKDGEYLNQSIINSDDSGKPTGVGINLGITDTVDLFLGSLLMKKEAFLKVLRHAMQANVSNTMPVSYTHLNEDDSEIKIFDVDGYSIYAYERSFKNESYLIIVNFTDIGYEITSS